MSANHEQDIINNDNNIIKPLDISSEENLRVLNMEDTTVANNCIKDIEIGNAKGTCSKKTLPPLEIEEVPIAMSDDCKRQTENLICDLHELPVKTSSSTCNRLTNQHGNEEENVNNDKINQQIQTVVVSSIIDRTQSNCSVSTGRAKKNTIDQYDSIKDIINNVVLPEKGIKRTNSKTSTLKKLTKRAKTISKSQYENENNVKLTSSFSIEFNFNANSTLLCMESIISRRRIIYKKRQEAREKLARMENAALKNIRKQKMKKVRRSPRSKKLNLARRDQQSKNQNNDTLHNQFKKPCSQKESDITYHSSCIKQQSKNQNNDTLHNQSKKPCSQKESDITYHSSCIFRNKNHDFNQDNKCFPKQYVAENTNEKKNGSWCAIM